MHLRERRSGGVVGGHRMWVLAAAALAAAADLGPLLRSCLPPDAVGGVAGSLAALGAEAPADLRWITDEELAGMGLKAVQQRKLRHAAAAAAATAEPPPPPPTPPPDAEAELLQLRDGGAGDCAGEPGPQPTAPAPAAARASEWGASDESDLKSLLQSLSLSVADELEQSHRSSSSSGGSASASAPALASPPPASDPPAPQPSLLQRQLAWGMAADIGDVDDPLTVPEGKPRRGASEAAVAISPDDGAGPPGTTPLAHRPGRLYETIEVALEVASTGSAVAPPIRKEEAVAARRQRLAFAVVAEASALLSAGSYRAGLALQMDALLLDSSAAAAHYNNIGVTNLRLNEVPVAFQAFNKSLEALAAGAPLWSEVRAAATQATILGNTRKMEQLEQLPLKMRNVDNVKLHYLSGDHPSLWLSSAEPPEGVNPQRRRSSAFSLGGVNFSSPASQSLEAFLKMPSKVAETHKKMWQQPPRPKRRSNKFAKERKEEEERQRLRQQKEQARQERKKKKGLLERRAVDRRIELWPMMFLHSYYLSDQAVVVADAPPSLALQRLAANASDSLQADEEVVKQLEDGLPYFLDTDAFVSAPTAGSNPKLFMDDAALIKAAGAAERRGIACGALWLSLASGSAPTRTPPLFDCCGSKGTSGSASCCGELLVHVAMRRPPASSAACLRSAHNSTASDSLPSSADPPEGRWAKDGCAHRKRRKHEACAPEVDGEEEREEWEVRLAWGETLFVPEGWEYSTRALGVAAATVAVVPFGWEEERRQCC